MGFFSRLFKQSSTTSAPQIEAIEYKDHLIYPEAISEQGQFRIAGRICKTIGDEIKTHHFIRSDLLGSEALANSLMVEKAKICIDQQANQLFKN